MLNVNQHFKFLNNSNIENINIDKQKISEELKNLYKIIYPNMVSIAKYLYLHENIYKNNFKNYKRIFDDYEELEKSYTDRFINKFSFPLYNRNIVKHSLKFNIKLNYFTLLKKFKTDEESDLQDKKICFYKPNALALVSSKWNLFEKLKINNYNNFEDLYNNKKFEINEDLFNAILLNFSGFFQEEIFLNIFKKICNKFVNIIFFLDFFVDNNLILPKSEKIIFGSESQILTKVIRYKLINKGYKIYTFEHGARSFIYKNDYYFTKYNRLLFANNYFLSGIGQSNIAKNYKDISKKIILTKNFEPKISNILNKTFTYQNNKKILYVLEMQNNRNFVQEPHNIDYRFQKNIIIFLIDFFQKNKLFFKLKKHPDSAVKEYSEFNLSGDLINFYHQFDVILFDHSQSTAFCEALNTNKKIILLDYDQNNFENNFKKMVYKRCQIIKTILNNNFSIEIDEKNLKDSILNDNKISDEVINDTRYFFRPKE